MRCSATFIFYHFNSFSGMWVRACKARTAYTVLDDLRRFDNIFETNRRKRSGVGAEGGEVIEIF
jgi:hypothetical protein